MALFSFRRYHFFPLILPAKFSYMAKREKAQVWLGSRDKAASLVLIHIALVCGCYLQAYYLMGSPTVSQTGKQREQEKRHVMGHKVYFSLKYSYVILLTSLAKSMTFVHCSVKELRCLDIFLHILEP